MSEFVKVDGQKLTLALDRVTGDLLAELVGKHESSNIFIKRKRQNLRRIFKRDEVAPEKGTEVWVLEYKGEFE